MAKKKAGKALTKTQLLNALAEKTGLSKKECEGFLESLEELIREQITKGPGVINIPGLLKIENKYKPATKARPGRNPATGEEIMIKAKPATQVVKVRALKNLKDMV